MRRAGLWLLKAGYVLVAVALILVILEMAARFIGLGEPILYYNDAWGGARPLPNQQVERLAGATVTIDANGYRSARSETAGALRILYLGDSVTWGGTSLNDDAVFSEVAADGLRARGRAVYAMNAGVNGTALVNHAEIFLHHADSVDAVVWLFPWGDVLRNYSTVGLLMPARFKPRFALVEVVDHLIFRYWIESLRERRAPEQEFHQPDVPTGRETFYDQVMAERKRKNLAAARAVVAEAWRRRVPLIIGVTPVRSGERLEALPAEAVMFLDEIVGPGVMRLDVFRLLERRTEGIAPLFIDHVHFSAAGHRVVGEALTHALTAALDAPTTAAPLQ